MKNVKLGHAFSFYMQRKLLSLVFSKQILCLSEAKRLLSPLYIVMDNLSVLLIFIEVLALGHAMKVVQMWSSC